MLRNKEHLDWRFKSDWTQTTALRKVCEYNSEAHFYIYDSTSSGTEIMGYARSSGDLLQ